MKTTNGNGNGKAERFTTEVIDANPYLQRPSVDKTPSHCPANKIPSKHRSTMMMRRGSRNRRATEQGHSAPAFCIGRSGGRVPNFHHLRSGLVLQRQYKSRVWKEAADRDAAAAERHDHFRSRHED